MKINLSENQKKNLLIFLNRVKYDGLDEVTAAMDLLATLNSPIVEEETKSADKEELPAKVKQLEENK